MSLSFQNYESMLRNKVWSIFKIFEKNKFFVHTGVFSLEVGGQRFEFPRVLGLAIINAIVGNGSMLLYGGYGYGKTTLLKILGRMMTGYESLDIENSILRANPQLTEEKITGRLELGLLIKEGREKVTWRRFVTSFWKIIDEINRLSPDAQDIILSLLGEGIIKYFDSIYQIRHYVLYATLNPRDVGTFPLGLPLLDRFGLAVIVDSPKLKDIEEIAYLPDDRVARRYIPPVLSKDELIDIWGFVRSIQLDDDAIRYISLLSKELSLCDRASKETGVFFEIGSKICAGCPFESRDTICKYTFSPLSVRTQRDLVRYSQALAWILGYDRVALSMVVSLAPYVIWHRLHFSERYLEEFGFDRFRFAVHITNQALRLFLKKKSMIDAFDRLQEGDPDPKFVAQIKRSASDDLLVKYEIAPFIDILVENSYTELAKNLVSAILSKDIEKIEDILEIAERRLNRVQYAFLLRTYERFLRKHSKVFKVSYSMYRQVIDQLEKVIKSKISNLSPPYTLDRWVGIDRIEITVIDHRDSSPVTIIVSSISEELPKFIESLFSKGV